MAETELPTVTSRRIGLSDAPVSVKWPEHRFEGHVEHSLCSRLDFFWDGASKAMLRLQVLINIMKNPRLPPRLPPKLPLYAFIHPENIKQLSLTNDSSEPENGLLCFEIESPMSLCTPVRLGTLPIPSVQPRRTTFSDLPAPPVLLSEFPRAACLAESCMLSVRQRRRRTICTHLGTGQTQRDSTKDTAEVSSPVAKSCLDLLIQQTLLSQHPNIPSLL